MSAFEEATALLERWRKYSKHGHPDIWSDTDLFLSRAPTQPAAPDEGPEPVPLHAGQDNGCFGQPPAPEPSRFQGQPPFDQYPERAAAPEPSADTPTAGCHDAIDYVPGETDRQAAVRWMRQAMSTETKLADMLLPASMHEELRLVMLGERRAKESAESQLAAVRAACLKVCPDGHGSVHISTAVLWPLLSPPSPSAVPGETQ